MSNLKDETIIALYENGKTADDVRWVGLMEECRIPLDHFWKIADVVYDDGYGCAEVPTRLVIVGDDWWLERGEYDGSEWWEFKTLPQMPELILRPEELV